MFLRARKDLSPERFSSCLMELHGSNPQLAFPCLDRLEQKTKELADAAGTSESSSVSVASSESCITEVSSLESGPEPAYSRVSSGFGLYRNKNPTFFDNGGYLPEYQIAYESWGTLSPNKDNLVLIHTGLSASSHAKSQPKNTKNGWWENFIGSGKYIDTDKYFVVCTNVLGGCYGSTGPSSKDPANNDYYATRFPIVTVNDMVRAQRELVRDVFGVKKLHASVGASMGGMQSLAYAWEFPDEVENVISISGCARSHPYSIALRHTQRQVLMSDPNWNRGFYYEKVPPHIGMKLAREIATVTYRSGPEWESRFGRSRADDSKPVAFCPDFLVETYLDHAGEKFCLEYDANSLLYVSKAMDLFDLGLANRARAQASRVQAERAFKEKQDDESAGKVDKTNVPDEPYQEKNTANISEEESLKDLEDGLKKISHKNILVVGVESDILFPVWQQREIASLLRKTSPHKNNIEYFEMGTDVSNYGHDTFLLSLDDFGPHVKNFLAK
ncbi:homoserine acetyltransferase [Metschnikowia bicuspidata var. bicuspidata NRRL YB-4993]|uniref:Homoserine acetyltransferase n=1 Tax=Metschnikowia bicuspidata var. bicuspidata NRRL YB-4993 TaxID=869754 RepID=A0A1A0H8C7_9ASCO|nr:homoserine acetyltransferase [Metschnikowia bicuspidata var. bicuspidata NRRL YB-4993]OBA20143.1 homoserine acetyltransferase [Metschnikowia bicuspidata var. bicuspidata NRRL YB-4993]